MAEEPQVNLYPNASASVAEGCLSAVHRAICKDRSPAQEPEHFTGRAIPPPLFFFFPFLSVVGPWGEVPGRRGGGRALLFTRFDFDLCGGRDSRMIFTACTQTVDEIKGGEKTCQPYPNQCMLGPCWGRRSGRFAPLVRYADDRVFWGKDYVGCTVP